MSHTYSKLAVHCIFSTKNRRGLIRASYRDRLHAYVGGVLREHGAVLVAAGGTADHMHVLLELPTTLSVADTMRLLKANTSRWLSETFPEAASFAWQTGYAAFSVSKSAVDEVTQYIGRQEEHHRVRTFDEELIEFLRRHGIEYDERYVFD